MKKPERRDTKGIRPEAGVHFYNQGLVDMEKYYNWRMSQLPNEEEIEKIIPQQCHGKRLRKMITKAISERIRGKE